MKINAKAFPYTKVKVKLFKCINDYKEFNNTILITDNRDSKAIECLIENQVSRKLSTIYLLTKKIFYIN